MPVLVTGGAGYIGSHAAHALVDRGEEVIVLDNLASGQRSLVPSNALFVQGTVGNVELLRQIIIDFRVDAVMHFAGSISVPESIEDPLGYYENNTVCSAHLVNVCVEQGVDHFVFSSTAAVYGDTGPSPVAEDAPTRPLSPYGQSKLMVEWILRDVSYAHHLRYVALRYFNVAGIDLDGKGGQPGRQVPHLIKRAAQVALGQAECLEIFGCDYPTRDGTGIRDFIHIYDLVDAHLLALKSLRGGRHSAVYNCGYGSGTSVLEVISAFERIIGGKLATKTAPRRAGDPVSVIADSTKIRDRLGWQPRFDDLDKIALSAVEWERRRPGN